MRKLYRHPISRRLVAGALMFDLVVNAMANPHGMTVQSGSATATANGPQLTITTSQNAALNWQSFNIAAGETTIFQQPSATSVVWNRVNDPNPSQIFGSLQANGVVVLLNSSGFYFGPNSFVSAAGLVVSTANCLPPQNSGGSWQFNGPPPLASIVNYGQIKVGRGGSAFLIADRVENHGAISAPGGTIGLAAGQTVLLSDRPDGRGMSMRVTLPRGSVDNAGRLIADGGTIAMNAQVVNQNGFIQANSVRNHDGVIELVAADQLNLGADSQILARGDDATPGSSGGSVTLKSGNDFSDSAGSQIITTGGAQGGNGGNVEISAPNVRSLNSSIDARAQAGWTAGKLWLDPDYIILDTSGPDSAGSGTVLAGDSPGSTLDLNVNSAFANLAVSQIILQAVYDITLADGTAWDLSGTIGANFGGVSSGLLTLEAGRNIIFGSGANITDANNWSVALKAGVTDFAAGTVQSSKGSIYLGGFDGAASLGLDGSIQTAGGSIDLLASQDITVGSGYVITTGGGSISAHALKGNIDTGSDAQGYHFDTSGSASSLDQAYDLQDGLGGISTKAGGDVTLIAGGNVTSVLPGRSGNTDAYTAGSGAYGSQPGDVTVVAGGNVTGQYLVANGAGNIFAGVKMDANGNPIKDGSGNYVLGATGSAGGTDRSTPGLALGLISGGWNVAAAQDILLQEVRNPNGIFDVGASTALKHYFDYSPGDYVNLSAGNLVQLGASSSALPRIDSLINEFIYPSILNVKAGAGGIVLGTPGSFTSLILFPSPEGSLTIDTSGSLVNGNTDINKGALNIFNLIVSDSGRHQFTTGSSFGLKDHAASPVHFNHPTPISLNIDGDMDNIFLGVPEAAQITVGGNINNCGFQGMNLSAKDVTSINVTGDINTRSAFTSIDLNTIPGAQAPDLSLLSQAYGTDPSATTLATSFYYNANTGTLTYQNISGKSLASVLQLLQNLLIQVYVKGVPQFDGNGNPITTTVSVLNAVTASALLAQFNALGPVPSGGGGYTIGGGGEFDLSARNLDLGTSVGIQSLGVGLYTVNSSYPLANPQGPGITQGADINVNVTGDLNMYSSSIASLNSGNIFVYAGGDINAGSSVFTVTTTGARGIYSSSGGNVSVYAAGNVNINGSRIATYDGGNVTVESLNGDVNAGSGGGGFVAVQQFNVNPATHVVTTASSTIPGNGVLTTTFLDSLNVVGNIFVDTPNGNIVANAGGIVQLPVNGADASAATIVLLAGKQPVLDTSANGNDVVQAYIYDAATKTWESEKGALQIIEVFNPKVKKNEKQIKDEPVLSDHNLVTWGATLQVLDASTGTPTLVSLTQILDAGGQPLHDANGLPLYVKSDDKNRTVVEYIQGKLTAYLDAGGDPVNVSVPQDASGNPILNPQGNPIFVLGRNIDANHSGVIGREIYLDATGNITGAFVGQDVSLKSLQNVHATVLAPGTVNVSANGDISGEFVGLKGVTADGGSGDPSLLSQNVSDGGLSSGTQTGFGQGTAANAASQSMQSEDSTKVTDSADNQGDDTKKKGKEIALAQKIGRVTVILPSKQPPPKG